MSLFGLPLAFAAPLALVALAALPAIWFLLKVTPPRPLRTLFPPLVLLERLKPSEETPARTPWWLVFLRMALAACLILAFAGPILRPAPAGTEAARGPLVLFIDTGWASATAFEARRQEARRLLDQARADGVSAVLIASASRLASDLVPADPSDVAARLSTLVPEPVTVDRHRRIEALLEGLRPLLEQGGTLSVLTDGLAAAGDDAFFATLGELAPGRVDLVTGALPTAALLTRDPAGEALGFILTRAEASEAPRPFTLIARDKNGRTVSTAAGTIEAGARSGPARFDLPLELRNAIARVELEGERGAGSVVLLDRGDRRQRVAIISGEDLDASQSQLSGSSYVARALQPYADLILPGSGNVSADIVSAISDKAGVLILTDIGTLTDLARNALEAHMADGGVVIRFASPALGLSSDRLVPVPLRQTTRQLGGALSWDTPQPLAPFPESSPFAGLAPSSDVHVARQLLAEPDPALRDRVLAELADGTPLVTGERRGRGFLALFHVTADTRWSDLPLSGLFVEMLRKLAALAETQTGEGLNGPNETALPPRATLDGFGALTSPPPLSEPIPAGSLVGFTPDLTHLPGLYGPPDAPLALNLFQGETSLEPLAVGALAQGIATRAYPQQQPLDLRPLLLLLALALAMLDTALMSAPALFRWLTTWRGRTAAHKAVLMLMAGALGAMVWGSVPMPRAHAENLTEPAIAIAALEATRLAYVVTGDAALDRISAAGLSGLSRLIAARTAFEPGEPAAINPDTDELSFYPLIYWPMPDAPITVSDTLIARIDAFMRNGGTILFDTRDEGTSLTGGITPATRNLRALLSRLDVPPLEPVPADHVLTKAFYLLNDFPGRTRRGALWVEALPERAGDDDRPARAGDGVSPLLISGNDLAAAWALDERDRPMMTTIPPDPRQREMAWRTGINIAIYVLTGNYKADQVHIPALLQRLGQ